jgi:hypothetical protein
MSVTVKLVMSSSLMRARVVVSPMVCGRKADGFVLLVDLRHAGGVVLAVEQADVHGDAGLLREAKVFAPSAHAVLLLLLDLGGDRGGGSQLGEERRGLPHRWGTAVPRAERTVLGGEECTQLNFGTATQLAPAIDAYVRAMPEWGQRPRTTR